TFRVGPRAFRHRLLAGQPIVPIAVSSGRHSLIGSVDKRQVSAQGVLFTLAWTRTRFRGATIASVLALMNLALLPASQAVTGRVLKAGRLAGIPIFFTTYAHDPASPPSPQHKKLRLDLPADTSELFALDPRLERRPTEKVVGKHYASAFKGTNFHEMLTSLGI